MQTLIFDEDTIAIIDVPKLTQSDKPGNEDLSNGGEARRNKGQVELIFFGDDFEYTTQPSKEQLNALEYIRNNQKKLVKAFFKYTKEVLYPVHIEFIGFEKIFFRNSKR